MRSISGLAAAAAAALTTLFAAGQARADWVRAETAHFVIYAGDEMVARSYSEDLELFHGLLQRELRTPKEEFVRKLPVYLVPNESGLRRVGPKLPEGVAGVYYPSPDDVFSVAITSRDDNEVLQHEYVHHFMLQNFPVAYPAWLVEGLADFWMTTDIQAKHIDTGKAAEGRLGWLSAPTQLPLRDVLTKRPFELPKGDGPAVYYARAWLLTHYLMQPQRRSQLQAYMNAVQAGGDPVTSLEKATGMDLPALERALRGYLGSNYKSTRYDRTAVQPAPPTITRLPASANDLLLENQQIKLHPKPEQAKELLAKIRSAAGRHRGDRFAELVLARAETQLGGDRAAGEAILNRLLAQQPKDIDVLLALARSRMAAGDAAGQTAEAKRAAYREARKHVQAALKVDPDRFDALFVAARTRSPEPDYPTKADQELLELAYFGAPQVSSIRLQLARMMISAGRHEDAIIVLGPLANSPHGGEVVQSARAALEQARKQLAAPEAAAAK